MNMGAFGTCCGEQWHSEVIGTDCGTSRSEATPSVMFPVERCHGRQDLVDGRIDRLVMNGRLMSFFAIIWLSQPAEGSEPAPRTDISLASLGGAYVCTRFHTGGYVPNFLKDIKKRL